LTRPDGRHQSIRTPQSSGNQQRAEKRHPPILKESKYFGGQRGYGCAGYWTERVGNAA
jgi:hypothetical protein